MGFKDLFIVSDEENTKSSNDTPRLAFPKLGDNPEPNPSKSKQTTFPDTEKGNNVIIGNVNCKPYMDQVMLMYERGFDGLNQTGIEFFEFYKAVSVSGIENPAAYEMAFNMLKGMDPGLSKSRLIDTSTFYTDEINKVHIGYQNEGNTKRVELENEKTAQSSNLASEIAMLNDQILGLQNQVDSKKLILSQMDQTFNPQLEEISCKLEANNYAKNIIQGNIQKVINGIKKNLK